MHRILLLAGSALLFTGAAFAQRAPDASDGAAVRTALADAIAEKRAAEQRSARFSEQAESAESDAERAQAEAAALAARIQQAEAGILAARARLRLIDGEQADLRETLGREQRPLVRLTAALQQFARRPAALTVLRPGDIDDVIYTRAVLQSTAAAVREDTSDLRGKIDRTAQLRREELAAAEALRTEEAALARRRDELADAETEARLAARSAGSEADREAERALALSEDVRDLDALVEEFDRAAQLRRELAALPGPRLRPATPETAEVEDRAATRVAADRSAPRPYMLPVTGRTVAGFGAPRDGVLSRGLTLAPVAGAQVVAPAEGRIAFAGPYRGYGRIVIIEHGGGWTSLVTGLARIDTRVGEEVGRGSPLGTAGPGRPRVTLELRRDGQPVNPLTYAR
ncbi:murein hydrolase activator EnvC family protein [Aurantiacibacter aquimixticola]|uniref:Metalloendopeptidase n=1 Tax=Aurantiacibacter aquimixticola TaxID=1958945 RepID=A0A419RUZ4_9SPHN|nr:peptidoglycan DD-metalloendopeptidase family protein [Aurantiacibacter aquimixticola]RJY09605.1 metalloendopeptidase [Aurantiacibacter aquimixticola]